MDDKNITVFNFKNGKSLRIMRSLNDIQRTLENNVLRGLLTLEDNLGSIFLIKLNEVVYVEEG